MKLFKCLVLFMVGFIQPCHAESAPDLDLTVHYYHRVLSQEGVVRESHYTERRLRRVDHVWVERVLPATLANQLKTGEAEDANHQFSSVLTPRHITRLHNQTKIEFVNSRDAITIAIPETEFENVHFDGSWENAFYLIDPALLAQLSVTKNSANGIRRYEREKDGIQQKVMWDQRRQIPLMIETGDKNGLFFNRIDITVAPTLRQDLPWAKIDHFGQKEYSDYLD